MTGKSCVGKGQGETKNDEVAAAAGNGWRIGGREMRGLAKVKGRGESKEEEKGSGR
jgi:hypothetical protein